MSRFIAVGTLFVAALLYLNLHRDLGVPMKKGFRHFPGTVTTWRMTRETGLSEQVQEVLRASDILYREYTNRSGERVELYVGYHDGGKESGEIHSPKHCLPGSGWFEVYSVPYEMHTQEGKLNLVRSLYQKGDARQLFLYWYQVGGESISDEYSLKLAEIVNSVLHRRRDATFIRVSLPAQEDDGKAAALGEEFVREFLPVLRQYLPG